MNEWMLIKSMKTSTPEGRVRSDIDGKHTDTHAKMKDWLVRGGGGGGRTLHSLFLSPQKHIQVEKRTVLITSLNSDIDYFIFHFM